MQIFINNDEVTSKVDRSRGDSVILQNRTADQQRQNQERVYQQKDRLSDSLAQQLAIKTVELDRLQKSPTTIPKAGRENRIARKPIQLKTIMMIKRRN